MKIAIEAFWLNTKKLTGVGYYILNVLTEIDKQDPGNIYYILGKAGWGLILGIILFQFATGEAKLLLLSGLVCGVS